MQLEKYAETEIRETENDMVVCLGQVLFNKGQKYIVRKDVEVECYEEDDDRCNEDLMTLKVGSKIIIKGPIDYSEGMDPDTYEPDFRYHLGIFEYDGRCYVMEQSDYFAGCFEPLE